MNEYNFFFFAKTINQHRNAFHNKNILQILYFKRYNLSFLYGCKHIKMKIWRYYFFSPEVIMWKLWKINLKWFSRPNQQWPKPPSLFHPRHYDKICPRQEIFLPSPWMLDGVWVCFFLRLHLFDILPRQPWPEAFCFQYVRLSQSHECDISQTHGGNFITLGTNVPLDSRRTD